MRLSKEGFVEAKPVAAFRAGLHSRFDQEIVARLVPLTCATGHSYSLPIPFVDESLRVATH